VTDQFADRRFFMGSKVRRASGFSAVCLLLASATLQAQNTVQQAPDSGSPQTYSSSDHANSNHAKDSAHNAAAGDQQEEANSNATPAPTLDPTGPSISLETDEALFDVMAGLNACGYDEELSISDPVRQRVREQMNQALAQSEQARTARDRLCAFVQAHTLGSARSNLAQYVSLALFLTPPPDLAVSVSKDQLPPDAAPITEYANLLHDYAAAVNLHLIWVLNRPAYDAEVEKLHDPMTKMILGLDLYMKQPPSQYAHRRFLVVLEPQIAPGEVNARVYGGDYIVVASPVNGVVRLREIKHTYLHYELEPLIYARAESIDTLQPLLERVEDAPLPFEDKNNIEALVTESMIRAIEARTMDTGVPEYVPPAHIDRSQVVAVNKLIVERDRKAEAVRQQLVQQDMEQGYILTRYFYQQFKNFESSPVSLEEAVGEMVYSIDVPEVRSSVQRLEFVDHAQDEVVQRTAPKPDVLDQAEKALYSGDAAKAIQIAEQALAAHTAHAGRAQFILARADLISGKPEQAVAAFQQAVKLSHDPRTLAWSHIYLGRIDDVQEDRDSAIAEYKAAMQTRDSRPDTEQAAEQGLKHPYQLPAQPGQPAPGAAGGQPQQ
jgi:tetratricopeptide (TPR) repeat protein